MRQVPLTTTIWHSRLARAPIRGPHRDRTAPRSRSLARELASVRVAPACITAEQLNNVSTPALDATGEIAGLEPWQDRILYDQFRGGAGQRPLKAMPHFDPDFLF